MVKSIFLRPWDMLCVIWFLVHIPITVMLDSHSSEAWSLASPSVRLLYYPPVWQDGWPWHASQQLYELMLAAEGCCGCAPRTVMRDANMLLL
jgi:hypothetical protein